MCSTTATVTQFCPADIQKRNKLDQLQDMAFGEGVLIHAKGTTEK